MDTGGPSARWAAVDGTTTETLELRFENGGWTVEGAITGLDVHYVVRFDHAWHARQLLVFRDLDEPDLWIATDGAGIWGEVDGAVRDELTGCTDVVVAGTPFVHTPPIRRADGAAAVALVATVDAETLGVRVVEHTYEPLGDGRWAVTAGGTTEEVTVDDTGLVSAHPSFRRLPGRD